MSPILSFPRKRESSRPGIGLTAVVLLLGLLAGWATPSDTAAAEQARMRRSARRDITRPVVTAPSTDSEPAPHVSTRPLQATAFTPAEFLIVNHSRNQTQFGSHTRTLISESQLSTATASDLAPFKVVYMEPSWGSYTNLTNAMAALTTYVQNGGTAVINIAGNIGNGTDIAPGGVDYSRATTHNSESILLPSHPYITGVPYGGAALSTTNFNSWSSTDHGTLSGFPVDAEVVLQNSNGPSWVQYRYGSGQVIVTTLTYGWGTGGASGDPHRNLIEYSLAIKRFKLTTPAFTSTTPITVTGTTADTTITKVKVQVRTDPFVDAVLDTVARTFSLANVSLNPDSNRVVAQGFTANDSLVAADTTVVILDQTPPVVDITSPAGGDTLRLTSAFNVTVQGIARDQYRDRVVIRQKISGIEGGVIDSTTATLDTDTTFTATITIDDFNGRLTIEAVAYDRVGLAAHDSITLVVFSPNLVDSQGFLYGIDTNNGEINEGRNIITNTYTSYDGWGRLQIYFNNDYEEYNNPTPGDTVAYSEDGRTLIFPPDTLSNGLVVSRKVWVPETSFLRYLSIVTNPTSDPLTVHLALQGYLENDSFTRATSISVGTFSLSNVSVANYLWFVTDDDYSFSDTNNPPALAHVFDGLGGIDKADSVEFEEDDTNLTIYWNNVTIGPGQTVAYLHVEAQRGLPDEGVTAARQLAGLPTKLYTGLTAGEIAALRNFPTNPDSAIGDVSGNRQVTAFDASLVLRGLVELVTLTPLQQIAGEVSGNGELSAYDASLILKYVSRAISIFPVRQASPKPIAGGGVVEDIPVLTVEPGGLVTVPVSIKKPADLLAMNFMIKYDPAVLEFVNVIPSALIDGWDIASSAKDGVVRVAMAGVRPVGGEGRLIEVIFRAVGPDGTRGTVTVAGLRLNETRMPDVDIPLRVGAAAIPTAFALDQNRPNPFNSATTIRYALKAQGHVILRVYNLLGQVVTTLVDGPQEAGIYTVRWNGRAATGVPVAGGVYFYRLVVTGREPFTATRKMVLIK
ncbi:MAG: T9SS type A sorting domain-containing protein [Candidatus Latescibacteria bacterium]|nr:T9SS type A sorting domain-containing protein [Candidatus Latescibacterota bacterium]